MSGASRRGVLAGLAALGHGGTAGAAERTPERGRAAPAAAPSGPWRSLPPTPPLPPADRTGTVEVGGARLFFAQFGAGPPVLLLHGGMANSDYWGNQIGEVATRCLVTVLDTRGHGRSTSGAPGYAYATFARDVAGVLDQLRIGAAHVVGWSDGGITWLQLAVAHPDRVASLFAFGANATTGVARPGGNRSPVFAAFASRAEREYRALSPRPGDWPLLVEGLRSMWRTQPNFTARQLAGVRVPVTIAAGEHDEIIRRDHTEQMARDIPGARLRILPGVSHFAMLQAPGSFGAELTRFLAGAG